MERAARRQARAWPDSARWAPQEVMSKARAGMGGAPVAKLNNVLMQMRKNCNHPDLIAGAFDGSLTYPSADELVAQVGAVPTCYIGENIYICGLYLNRGGADAPAGVRAAGLAWQSRRVCRHARCGSRLVDRCRTGRRMCRLPQALLRASPHGRLTGCAAAQCGKLALLDRILTRLHRDGHKVLIFSQVRAPPSPYLPLHSAGRAAAAAQSIARACAWLRALAPRAHAAL